MKSRMLAVTVSIFLAVSLAASASISASIPAGARAFEVTEAFLKADSAENDGPCPVTVRFSGYISVNGPGTVKYTFTRSDGATGPVEVLTFKAAGAQMVATTWTLGDSIRLPFYTGWQAIKVLSPNELESSREAGKFEIKCLAEAQTGTKIVTTPEPEPSGRADKDSQTKKKEPVGQIEILPRSDKTYKILPDGEIVVGE